LKPSIPLANWVPVQLQKSNPELLAEWLYLDDKRFTEPFFEDTILACRRHPLHQRQYKVVADLDTMLHWSEELPIPPLKAIIFHVSRCGSTLLSQLLAADEKNVVLSEVPFLDAMLRLPYQRKAIEPAKAEKYFEAGLAFYGRQRIAAQERLFVKADSWHLHFYPQLRRLFPGMPFFLLFREPMGVIRSQQKQRGIQSVPGMIETDVLGLTTEEGKELNLDRYMAHVLKSFYRQMIAIQTNDPLAIPLRYENGMEQNIRQLYQRLNLPVDNKLAAVFANRCRFNAKHPQQVFAEEEKNQEMPAFLADAFQLYQELVLLSEPGTSVS
jgi:hypothetical protein